MDDQSIIATLVPADSDLAVRCFQLPHNRDRYLALTSSNVALSSKENDPSVKESQWEDDDFEHSLQLSFALLPKNLKRGFVFGWGPECDVQLVDRANVLAGDKKRLKNISETHFSIAFDAEGRLVLRDTSSTGTCVSYGGQAQDEIRSHFTWILFPGDEIIEVSIPSAKLTFEIRPSPQMNSKEFVTKLDAKFPPSVRMGRGGLASPMLQLNVRSQNTSVAPSGAVTPRYGPIYLLKKKIGKGGFGTVYKVVDVSTGAVYAGKAFDESECDREVAIMREVKHDHIVCFVAFREKPSPLIVMEYLPLGNLADVHLASPITLMETLSVLDQALQAMVYLNNRGYIHRDIKPANILVSCRDPLAVKLADFGLAKHDRNGLSTFETFAGTLRYTAPEIYDGETQPYCYKADIWSLGVVALELAYGLPEGDSGRFNPGAWSQKILKFVQGLVSNELIDFLLGSMLRPRPEERLSASECLDRLSEVKDALQLSSTRALSTTPSVALTAKKASALTTIKWRSKDSGKRQRSPDPDSHTNSSRRKTVRRGRDDDDAPIRSHIYPITDASLFYSNEQSPVYDSILDLLKDIISGDDGLADSRTLALVQTLCHHLQRLGIAEIRTSTDHKSKRIVLTAITETREFTFASLDSYDCAHSIAHLARCLGQIMHQLSPDRHSSSPGHVSHRHDRCDQQRASNLYIWDSSCHIHPVDDETPRHMTSTTKALPSPTAEESPGRSMNDTDSWQTGHSKGLTYPSAMSDVLNVSGCTVPFLKHYNDSHRSYR